jgi:PTS system ascorbate-specific IIA component
MVGIVVIAHAPLASALSQCAEHVYSCEPNARRELRALDVDDNADLAHTVAQARELVHEVDHGEGVLILTTPSERRLAMSRRNWVSWSEWR